MGGKRGRRLGAPMSNSPQPYLHEHQRQNNAMMSLCRSGGRGGSSLADHKRRLLNHASGLVKAVGDCHVVGGDGGFEGARGVFLRVLNVQARRLRMSAKMRLPLVQLKHHALHDGRQIFIVGAANIHGPSVRPLLLRFLALPQSSGAIAEA